MNNDHCLNGALCFISSARALHTYDDVISSCESFYSSDEISVAKTIIYDIVGENPPKRIGSGKDKRDLQDILDLFDKCDETNKTLPTFVTNSFKAMPPHSSGFLMLSKHIVALMDEISSLKEEVSSLKESRNIADEYLSECCNIKEDISDIKKMLIVKKSPEIATKTTPTNYLNYTDTSVRSKIHVQNQSLSKPHDPIQNKNEEIKEKTLFSEVAASKKVSLNVKKANSDNIEVIDCNEKNNVAHINTQDGNSNDNNQLINVSENKDSDWTIVRNKNFRKNKNFITGSRNNGNYSLKSAPKIVDVFLGGCAVDCSEDEIKSYCLNELHVTLNACSSIVSKNIHMKCFKLTLQLHDREKLLNPESWPNGIYIRKFYNRKNISA